MRFRYNNLQRFVFFSLVIVILSGIWTGCTKSDTPVGKTLYKKTKNKIYQKLDADSLAEAFKTYLAKHARTFKNPRYLRHFYQVKQFEPVLLTRFYGDSSLSRFMDYLSHVDQHGLSPRFYAISALNHSLQALNDKSVINTQKEAYLHIAAAELSLADAFTNYSFALQYGQLNPRKSLSRYYIPTIRPDSIAFMQVLATKDMGAYLDSIQPRDPGYKQMQQALQTQKGLKAITLVANLERLRWKFERDSDLLVYVNIPAYQLTVVKDGKPVQRMKVVVGKANGHETPLLSSRIHSVQVNPVWNIPTSIAKKEILVQAKVDKFYLSNHGMDVYYKGKKISDADSIDWSGYTEENLPYSFKQRPGDANSLGLIKFLFNNGSSVYLHDTPVKAAFDRKMRASSHGCVRVEKPSELAYALFGEGEKYNTIQEEMGSENPIAKTISLEPKAQVLLDYMTCLRDDTGKLTYYPDVYGIDSTLYRLLQ